MAGEIRLIDTALDEARKAKKRLGEHHQERRERHGKSRVSLIEDWVQASAVMYNPDG